MEGEAEQEFKVILGYTASSRWPGLCAVLKNKNLTKAQTKNNKNHSVRRGEDTLVFCGENDNQSAS